MIYLAHGSIESFTNFQELVNSKINIDFLKKHSRFVNSDSVTLDISLGPLTHAGVMSTTAPPAGDMSITVAPASPVLVYKEQERVTQGSECGQKSAPVRVSAPRCRVRCTRKV